MPYLLDYPLEDFQNVLAVNLVAPFLFIKKVLPAMIEQGGSIINVTSDAGRTGYPGWGAYGISKFGFEGMSETWAAELAETGVRVNWVDPGAMNTEMHRLAEPDEDPAEWADPSDVTEVFIYLASDESAGVTGQRFMAQEKAWGTGAGRSLGRCWGRCSMIASASQLSFVNPARAGRPGTSGTTWDRAGRSSLLVIDRSSGELSHTRFNRIGEFLTKGDVLVFNRSRTLPASLPGSAINGGVRIEVRLAEHLPDASWLALILCRDGEPFACDLRAASRSNLAGPFRNCYQSRRDHTSPVANSVFAIWSEAHRLNLSCWAAHTI